MLIVFASGAISFGISESTAAISQLGTRITVQALAQGGFQGSMAGVQGGNFWQAFASGALASIAASTWSGGTMAKGGSWGGIGGKFAKSGVGQITFGTISGGGGAALSGGNFWEGAITGLAVSSVNYLAQNSGQRRGSVDFGDYIISSEELKDNLYRLSEYIGNQTDTDPPTIVVTSGDRSPTRNRAAGGASRSRHLVGDAADIYVNGFSNRQLSIYAHESGLFNTTIYYPRINATGALRSHVHLDLRPRTSPAILIYQPTIRNGAVTRHRYTPFNY